MNALTHITMSAALMLCDDAVVRRCVEARAEHGDV